MVDAFIMREMGWTWDEYQSQPDRIVTALVLLMSEGLVDPEGDESPENGQELRDVDKFRSLPMEAL